MSTQLYQHTQTVQATICKSYQYSSTFVLEYFTRVCSLCKTYINSSHDHMWPFCELTFGVVCCTEEVLVGETLQALQRELAKFKERQIVVRLVYIVLQAVDIINMPVI